VGVFLDGVPCDGRGVDVGGRDGGADAAAEEDDQDSRELGGEFLARNNRPACVGLGSIHGVDGYDAAASSLSFPT
jgi:hypothetical protein